MQGAPRAVLAANAVPNLVKHLGTQPKKFDAVPVLRFGILLAPHHCANYGTKAVLDKVLKRKRQKLTLFIVDSTLNACAALTDINDQAFFRVTRRRIQIIIAYPRILVDYSPAMLSSFFHWHCITYRCRFGWVSEKQQLKKLSLGGIAPVETVSIIPKQVAECQAKRRVCTEFNLNIFLPFDL